MEAVNDIFVSKPKGSDWVPGTAGNTTSTVDVFISCRYDFQEVVAGFSERAACQNGFLVLISIGTWSTEIFYQNPILCVSSSVDLPAQGRGCKSCAQKS